MFEIIKAIVDNPLLAGSARVSIIAIAVLAFLGNTQITDIKQWLVKLNTEVIGIHQQVNDDHEHLNQITATLMERAK